MMAMGAFHSFFLPPGGGVQSYQMLHMVGVGHRSLTRSVREMGLEASVRTMVYPTILYYLKAVFGMAAYPPNTLCKLSHQASCIKGFTNSFDVHATVNQGHQVEVQFLGGQLSIKEMVRVCRQYLDNADPLPAWAKCSYLKETYKSYNPYFSVRHKSTPPTLDQRRHFVPY